MVLFSAQQSNNCLKMLFSDKNALKCVKITNSISFFIELTIFIISVVIFANCDLKQTQGLIFIFFLVFITLFLIGIISHSFGLFKIFKAKELSGVNFDIVLSLLDGLNDLFLNFWSLFGFFIIRMLYESKYNVPFHLKAVEIVIFLKITLLFLGMVFILSLFLIMWYVVYKIPVKPFKDVENKSNYDCLICLEQFEDNSMVKILCCKHYFHVECFEKWLPREKTCPLCRKFVTRLDED
ncbi:putative E3 ubiquitin ligase [Pseudoloma neurophilia]|uniref:Putative E3 ubiquitin ligase n=1 Tax=Pseudoloma neurophilia TaxID=146866 RepID=A0A0R0M1A6_9MICR|nr:putative E3 ubiquitin ligase [Pseudoloma neurophilia]